MEFNQIRKTIYINEKFSRDKKEPMRYVRAKLFNKQNLMITLSKKEKIYTSLKTHLEIAKPEKETKKCF